MKWVGVGLIYLMVVFARFSMQFQARASLDKLVDKEIKVVGRISSEPILQGMSQSFRVGRIRVRTKSYPGYEYGQKVVVSGSLKRKVVNKWQARFSLMYPDIKIIKEKPSMAIGYVMKEKILKGRKKIESVYNQVLPEPEASLLAGIVLGVKRSLPRDFWRALQKSGTLHIVVASGYNITLVIGVIVKRLAGIFKRRKMVWLGIGAAGVYSLMAGAEPAIIRAAIMGSLAYLAQVMGRKADGVRLLVIAGLSMILYDPNLVFDLGFQLSIGATAGLMLIAPLLARFFQGIPLIGGDLRDTISAQMAVWPIILINFGQMSVLSVVVNGLVLWLVPIVMSLGAGLAILGLIFLGWGQVLGWLIYGPLRLMTALIEVFGAKSWMSVATESLSWWWAGGYYLALFLFLIHLNWRRNKEEISEMDLK